MPTLSSGPFRPPSPHHGASDRNDLGLTLYAEVYGKRDAQSYHAWLRQHGEYALLAEVTTPRFWLDSRQGMTVVKHKRLPGEFLYDGKTQRVLSVRAESSLDAGVFALAIKARGLRYALGLLEQHG